MMNYTKQVALVVLLALAAGCGNGQDENIGGAYARQWTRERKNINTEKGISTDSIRDTIIIRSKQERYEVENHRWSMNDYDQDGWRDQQHANNRPMPAYTATYDAGDRSLNSATGLYPPITLSGDTLFKGNDQEHYWIRVK